MSKKINRQLLQDILSRGAGVRTVSGDAIDWCIAVAEEAAKNLAQSGRRTPSGRLMAPKMDPGLMARHLTKEPEQPADKAVAPGDTTAGGEVAADGDWGLYHDWQTAVKQGKTKLPFSKWKEQKQ